MLRPEGKIARSRQPLLATPLPAPQSIVAAVGIPVSLYLKVYDVPCESTVSASDLAFDAVAAEFESGGANLAADFRIGQEAVNRCSVLFTFPGGVIHPILVCALLI